MEKSNIWLKYPATSAGYEEMLSVLLEFATEQGISPKRQLRLELGFEEAAVNIISYAYDEPGDVYLRLSSGNGAIYIELFDYGEPFNPLEKHVERAKELEARQLGGLGIDLMRRTFAQMDYSYEEIEQLMGNHLTLVFTIGEKE